MGILTNFLKLLKPEPNDFVDVAKHISENYDKLDENAKTNNDTLANLKSNKLDKGTYLGKASDLKTEIDTKLDKGTYSGNASDLNTEIDKIASTTQLGRIKVGTNLRIDSSGFLHGNPAVDISGKLDKGTYSGNAGNLKAEIDGKVSKSGDTMTGTLTISDSKHSEVVFNNIDMAAIGYNLDGKFAYFRAAGGTGLYIYKNNAATLQANNLNTKNKEVVAAINELNSRGFVKIGECLRVDQSVSIYGYNEFVVCEQYSPNTILDIKYFTKDIVNSLKSFKFISCSSEIECEWVFSADGTTITLTSLGAASDGGIYVYGR
jgi:hypothetical protein